MTTPDGFIDFAPNFSTRQVTRRGHERTLTMRDVEVGFERWSLTFEQRCNIRGAYRFALWQLRSSDRWIARLMICQMLGSGLAFQVDEVYPLGQFVAEISRHRGGSDTCWTPS